MKKITYHSYQTFEQRAIEDIFLHLQKINEILEDLYVKEIIDETRNITNNRR